MSAFKVTPGPWGAALDHNSRPIVWGPGTWQIADCWHTPDGNGWANARLIAAAPELLAAAECDAAMDLPTEQGWLVLERHGWNREDRFDLPASEFVSRLRAAAIAKATGGAA